MSFIDYVLQGLSILTITGGILVVGALLISSIPQLKKIPLLERFDSLLTTHALVWGFIISLTATLGSLFLSEIALFAPCKLCWFQRIFMYPQTVLFGVALVVKDQKVKLYALTLSIIGGLIAAYHYFLQVQKILFPNLEVSTPCSIVGYAPSCTEYFVLKYGYITIPMMALTAFVLIALIMIKSIRKK